MDNIPTVHPYEPFDPRADADALHKAIKGFGTDEKTLIAILCHRTRAQRTAINHAYKSGYGKDLKSELKSELSGHLEKVMVALSCPMDEFLASEIHKAISGLGTDENTLVEILCSGTNQEIRDISSAYLRLYGQPLEKDIEGDTSGCFQNLLVALVQGQRDESESVDFEKAAELAERLYSVGEGKFGTDESTFHSILATTNWAQLRQVMSIYSDNHSHTLEKAVASEFSFVAKRGLLTILDCAKNRHAYFAQQLNDATRGLGTNDCKLIRILVNRCDVDLGSIKREYQQIFHKSLSSDVAGDTSGDYKKALLALIA